jgi:NADH-quinone oxidoreductase subunit L
MMPLSLIPWWPLVSFLVLIIFARRLSWLQASLLSVGSVFLSALCSLLAASQLAHQEVIRVSLWQWFSLGEELVNFGFHFDMLSAVMCSVVSGVGALIHLFAAAYMKTDVNFSRFMAYMNLFIVAMLILVLADNLVLLYLGWEGVGLCSFLLIGFWYQEKANVLAARKAFIITRIGDTAMAIGLFLLFREFSTLDINRLLSLSAEHWQTGEPLAFWAALLLVGGAAGKSAQLPLQTWLPDAMAGPTPVSALIHAATMVTAGVYLIARMQGIFLLAPEVMTIVAWMGALTLLIAGIAALAQTDIKRVLAYSTMSQIGYMMLALGAGAWGAAVFHLMTHAFFKALLFLGAGYIILALHHQQDIFQMGGLLRRLPRRITLCFAIGMLALVAFPGTAGFASKEAIIAALWSSSTAGPIFWWMAVLGAVVTSVYSFRLLFIVFCGTPSENKLELPSGNAALMMQLVLLLLALLSLLAAWVSLDFSGVFVLSEGTMAADAPWRHYAAVILPLLGIAIAYYCYFPHKRPAAPQSRWQRFARDGLGFDWIYHQLLIKPFVWLARINQKDFIDRLLLLLARFAVLWSDIFRFGQTGNLRWYVASIGVGVAFLLAVILLWAQRQQGIL